LMTALVVGLEPGDRTVAGIAVALFVVGSLAVGVPVARAARGAAPRRDLVALAAGRSALVGAAVFVAVLVAVLLATGLSLKASGVAHPATITVAITSVVFAAGGQLLMRHLAAAMARRAGSR
jgi:hypothetical protein